MQSTNNGHQHSGRLNDREGIGYGADIYGQEKHSATIERAENVSALAVNQQNLFAARRIFEIRLAKSVGYRADLRGPGDAADDLIPAAVGIAVAHAPHSLWQAHPDDAGDRR